MPTASHKPGSWRCGSWAVSPSECGCGEDDENQKGCPMNRYVRTGTIIVLALALAACGGPEERKAKYRLRAQDYIQHGNFAKARVALRNVLKIDPKDAEAYYLFAQVEEKERNWRNAFANYQRVIELMPDHEKAQLRLAKYYLESRMVEKVSEIVA